MSKVLIVEDDPFLSKMYAKKFQVSGFEVKLVNDGVEGFIQAKSFAPDIIIMDNLMPKQNGVDTLDQLKAEPNTQNIPVIMATNLSTTDDADMALKKGAVKYVVKSEVTPSELVKIASEYIKK